MASGLDKEKIRKKIAKIIDMTQSDDPVLLSEYRNIFKKEISFFRRSWTAAWLLMYFDRKEFPRSFKQHHDGQYTKNDEQRVFLQEDESKQLFVGIGKNRHVFPREILTLIISKTSIPREDIGNIRILDNYSFVQVRSSQAQKIIDTLNGLFFRGRNLIVNYAKSKNDDSEEIVSEQEENHIDEEDI